VESQVFLVNSQVVWCILTNLQTFMSSPSSYWHYSF